MSNDKWSKEWPNPHAEQTGITKELLGVKPNWPSATFKAEPWPEAWVEPASNFLDATIKHGSKLLIDMIDIATKPDRITAIIGHMKDGGFMIDQHLEGDEARAVIEAYNNKVPTHDPYTNPDMHIYHECGCGAILDPNTKSFATLNTAASYVGWKIRWGVHTYKAYCFECGKDVE